MIYSSISFTISFTIQSTDVSQSDLDCIGQDASLQFLASIMLRACQGCQGPAELKLTALPHIQSYSRTNTVNIA